LAETAAIAAAQRLDSRGPPPDAQQAKAEFAQKQGEWEAEKSSQRRFIYRDVEELLITGFLSHRVQVGRLDISLRSLSPGDLFLLNHRCGRNPGNKVWKVWVVATGIWMVNGFCLLEEPHAVNRMHRIVRGLPEPTIEILFSLVMGLYNRTTTALHRTEAFCYEPYSRSLWRMCGRNTSSDKMTGIPGGERLGQNYVQRTWVAFNLGEDARDEMLHRWNAAKLIASASSPKGVRSLNAADERLHQREEDRRRQVIEAVVRKILYGEEEEQEKASGSWKVQVQGQSVDVPAVKVAKTDAELEDQFRAWVAGEKDWHDIVVDTYKERIRQRFEKEKKERTDAIDAAMQRAGTTGQTNMVGYTIDQLREVRPDLVAERPVSRRVFDGDAPASLYQKYLREDANPGRLHADESGVYESPAPPASPSESLQEKIQGRRPAFSTDSIDPAGTEGVD